MKRIWQMNWKRVSHNGVCGSGALGLGGLRAWGSGVECWNVGCRVSPYKSPKKKKRIPVHNSLSFPLD